MEKTMSQRVFITAAANGIGAVMVTGAWMMTPEGCYFEDKICCGHGGFPASVANG
jgi:hypothetical protein